MRNPFFPRRADSQRLPHGTAIVVADGAWDGVVPKIVVSVLQTGVKAGDLIVCSTTNAAGLPNKTSINADAPADGQVRVQMFFSGAAPIALPEHTIRWVSLGQ